MVQLVQPDSPELWRVARALVQEYAASLDFDLCFQDFAHELEALAEEYAPPRGCFYLASWEGEFVGCGALRLFAEETCEMKRLYVAPAHRGRRIGQTIARALVDRARYLGYRAMLLDTLPSMEAAMHVYLDLGFTRTTAYRENPVHGATFLRLEL